MMNTLRVYSDYKDSGLPWLGRIPKHWDCLPHRVLFEEIKEQGHMDEPLLSVTIGRGIIQQEYLLANSSKKDSSNLDKSKYKLVEPGDIAYNKMRAWQGAVGVSQYRGIVSPAYIVQRVRNEHKPEFFHYLFRTPGFAKEAERWSYGITSDQWSLRPQHFKMIYSCVPPRDEQDDIIRFLHDFDRNVRRFIRNRQRLIEVLNEQKQAIINRAVTRGLDPNVKLKPSGIDWLGGIPELWEVRKLGNLGSFSKGRGISRADITDAGVPAITYGDIYTTYGVEAKQLEKYTSAFVATNAQKILKGDLLFTASGETIEDIGKTTLYSGDVPGYAGGDIIILRPTEGDGLYLSYVLNSSLGIQQKSLFGRGDIIVHIAVSKLKQIIVPFPSKEEQTSIARFLYNALKCLHSCISRAKHEIDLVREYRTRLIADVVTGKVDVRGIAVERKKSAATVIQFPKEKKSGGPKGNVHFRRSVFAAEIVHRLHAEPTFGHVKFEKLIFLCEKQCGVDTGSTYYRQAAGPYDNRALRSIDSQMKKQKWYAAQQVEGRYRYVPLTKAGGHKTHFDRYFADIEKEFSNVIETFRRLDTERCEIVATLYSAWEDLLKDDIWVSDERIVNEVLNNWHESKKRISRERWEKALNWMRQNGFVPATMRKSRETS